MATGKSIEELAAEITIAWIPVMGQASSNKITSPAVNEFYDGIFKQIQQSLHEHYHGKPSDD